METDQVLKILRRLNYENRVDKIKAEKECSFSAFIKCSEFFNADKISLKAIVQKCGYVQLNNLVGCDELIPSQKKQWQWVE